MAFGFPAYHTQRFEPGAIGNDPKGAVVRTLKALNWTIKNESETLITASTSISFWSWGEQVLVQFESDGSVEITSKCSLPTQCIDWGKNARNVQKFADEIEQQK